MLIFGGRRLLSLKNCQMCPQNSFLRFSLKIRLFFEKIVEEKLFSIWFLIKKAIFIFGVRWPLTSQAPFNPYFYVPKYRSSDALPVPEIFFLLPRGCLRPVVQKFATKLYYRFHNTSNKEYCRKTIRDIICQIRGLGGGDAERALANI